MWALRFHRTFKDAVVRLIIPKLFNYIFGWLFFVNGIAGTL